jgi:hypothetical protein
VRGQGVMFGGRDSYVGIQTGFNDTWIYDGQWQQVTPAHTPPRRYGHVMAFDSARGEVVMGFGIPYSSGTAYRDTWLWNGSDWRMATPATLPPANLYSAMTFHAATSTCLLKIAVPNETWEWDGTDWTLRTPVNSPTIYSNVMAYDAARQRSVLLLSPTGSQTNPQQQWEWDGSNWTQMPALGNQRYNGALFYDENRGRLVQFGGQNYWSTPINDTWEFDGTNWTQVQMPSPPPGRFIMGSFYDSWRGQGVMFGGMLQTAVLYGNDETWTYSGPSPASVVSFAPGCPGPAGTPAISVVRRPILGDTYEIHVDNLAPNTLTFMMTGWSMSSIHIGSIVSVGSGCYVRASPDFQTPMFGTNAYTMAVPNAPIFLGVALHNQAVQLELNGSNLASASASNAVRMVMGNP